jgi:putative ABC transport system permease protein
VRSDVRSGTLLAMRELRRGKVRFALLAAAVALLSFLIVFQQAVLGQLVNEFVGAIRQQSADVLVYDEQARVNLQLSTVDPSLVERVEEVEGVVAAGPLGVATLTVEAAGELADAALIGYQLGAPGSPRVLSAGRFPETGGEAVAAESDEPGFGLGDLITPVDGNTLEIVGLAPDASLSVMSTLYVSYPTYQAARLAQNPDAVEIPPSAVAVGVAPGAEPEAVATAVNRAIDGVVALDREAAAEATPGVESINQSLALILLLSYAVILLVTGFFFVILTVQKSASLTLLRALGAPAGSLVTAVLVQTVVVVVSGFVVGVGLSAIALVFPAFLGATLEASPVGGALGILLVLGLLASLGAIRRVLRIEPVEATMLHGAIR